MTFNDINASKPTFSLKAEITVNRHLKRLVIHLIVVKAPLKLKAHLKLLIIPAVKEIEFQSGAI